MKVYRSRKGKLLGVCQGLADVTGTPVRYIRFIFVLAAFFTIWWTGAIYLIAALLLPVRSHEEYESTDFKDNFGNLRDDALESIRRESREFREATAGFSRSKGN